MPEYSVSVDRPHTVKGVVVGVSGFGGFTNGETTKVNLTEDEAAQVASIKGFTVKDSSGKKVQGKRPERVSSSWEDKRREGEERLSRQPEPPAPKPEPIKPTEEEG